MTRTLLITLALLPSLCWSQTIPNRDAASDMVGATVGEFRVDEGGQASYAIPLYVPPGTAGVQPNLSLVYNSGGGPGALGKGWSLGGVSVMTRCRASREAGDFIAGGVPVDGDGGGVIFRQKDRFCLDGQRLILISTDKQYGDPDAEYRLELDRFTRIYSRGGFNPTDPDAGSYTGPSYFEVQRRDGSTSFYGNTVDSYIEGNGRAAQVATAWAMNRMLDSTGNYIDYEYEENAAPGAQGEFVLRYVRYTGKVSPVQAPHTTITLNYATVAVREGYVGGSRATRTRRLESIDVAGMRWYKLGYIASASGTGEDTLTTLKECRDSSETVCYPATSFTWTNATQNYDSTGFRTDTGLEDMVDFRLGDVDGDGRLDLVYVRDTGGGCPSNVINVRFAVRAANGSLQFPRINGQPSICTGHPSTQVTHYWQLLDYDGDGRDDLLLAEAQGATPRWRIRPAVGEMGFDVSRDLLTESGVTLFVSEATGIEVADFNGDGLPDILFGNSAGGIGVRYLERGGVTGFRFSDTYAIDAQAAIPGNVACHTNSFPSCLIAIYSSGPLRPQDYDGDGRADIVVVAFPNLVNRPADGFVRQEDLQSPEGLQNFYMYIFHTQDRVEQPQRRMNLQLWWTSYDGGFLNPPTMPKWLGPIGDFNGDGLADFLGTYGDPGDGYQVCKNRGAKGVSFECSGPLLTGLNSVKAADVNGDGRSDLLHLPGTSTSTWQNYQVRYAGLDGMLPSTSVPMPGNGTQGVHMGSSDIFADFDGDGAPDYLAVYPIPEADNERTGTASASVRFKPKDVITEITNGYGAKTTISYLPLSNGSVYTKDTGSRNSANYGRGSPVLDLLAPVYVVSHVQSDAPVFGNAAARSTVSYRYAGAKMQAGGRGMLGFREIVSTDHNFTGTPVGHVVSRTVYEQAFPHIGMPVKTEKWVVAGSAPALGSCRASGIDADSCAWTYGQAAPVVTGSMVQVADTLYDTIPDFTAGSQAALHSYTLVTQERRYALPLDAGAYGVSRGDLLAYVATGECGHDAWGNPGLIGVDTHGVDPFPTMPQRIPAGQVTCGAPDPAYEASVETRKRTINTWIDPGSTWRLGRLALSEVQHTRRVNGTLVTDSRFAQFDYESSGTTAGLLKSEKIEPGAIAPADELRTFYTLDVYGNQTASYVCSADVSETLCRNPQDPGNPMRFRPEGLSGEPSTSVRRYSRTTYDTIGRYATAGYEPFFDPSQTTPAGSPRLWSERATWTACTLGGFGTRDEFGELQCVDDANGVTTKSRRGHFGREYWNWVETDPTPNTGVATTITYAWCAGVNGGTASCPDGAKFRRQTANSIAATVWTYFDVLGREIATAAQSFNESGGAPAISIACVGFDAHGRSLVSTEPQFLSGFHAAAPSFAGQASVCTATGSSLRTTTTYDVLGRATKVIAPDGGETRSTHLGLVTVMRAPCNNEGVNQLCEREWTEQKNASGETVSTMDADGLVVHFQRDEFGNLEEVRRNAGTGDVVNSASYDTRGRKIAQSDLDGGSWSFQYNAAGELIKRVDARGQSLRMDIDARGRVWRTRATHAPTGPCPDCLFANGFENTGAVISGTVEDEIQYDTAANGLGLVHWDTRREGGNPNITRTYSYDGLARPITRATLLDAKTYVERTIYDNAGRVLKSLVEYTENYNNPGGAHAYLEGAEYFYGPRGHLTRVCRANDVSAFASQCPGSPNFPVYWRVISQDARGQVLQDERHGSVALQSTRTYNASTGRLATLKSGTSDSLQNLLYAYDPAGNLLRREDYRGGTKIEAFRYDALDRLVESKLTHTAPHTTLMTLSYDALGNICSKNGNAYTYEGRAGCAGALGQANKSPHAVTQAFGTVYHYDANGLQIRADADGAGTTNDRYTEFDAHHRMVSAYVGSVTNPTFQADYQYAPDLSLATQVERATISGVVIRRTHYVGNLEWTDRNPGGTANREARLSLPGGLVLVRRFVENQLPETNHRYLFFDGLGSVDVIASETGAELERMSFDAHGRRRDDTWIAAVTYGLDATTRRGYTGHEQIDGARLVHMRARMYDPQLGRFIQPDPMVEADATQGWNRYSYVLNNPLSATDPTGMLSRRQAIRAARVIVAIAVSIWLPNAGIWAGTDLVGFGAYMVSGFVAGGISGGWQGAIWGAFSAFTFQAVGAAFPGAQGSTFSEAIRTSRYWHKVLAHGTAGGVLNTLQGGKFGHGFLSAGLTAAVSPSIAQLKSHYAQAFAGALLGGSVSELTGGNFANGAMTAAFAQAFGLVMESHDSIRGSQFGGSGGTRQSPFSDGVIGTLGGDGFGPPAPFATIEEAARAGLAEARPIGHTSEYAGAVVSFGNGYYATSPVTIGDPNDFAFSLRHGLRPLAIYHTHPIGGYAQPALSLAFSRNDVAQAEALGVRSYVGMYHDGSIRMYDPATMSPRTIRDFSNTGITLRNISAGVEVCARCF